MTPPIEGFSGRYTFLSMFDRLPGPLVDHAGISYWTAEAMFQARKTTNLADRRVIARLPTPAAAKQYGQRVLLRPHWDATLRLWVMGEINRAKFDPARFPDLAGRLLDTGDAALIHRNRHGDTYWGVVDGVGANHLGRLLEVIRDDLCSTLAGWGL